MLARAPRRRPVPDKAKTAELKYDDKVLELPMIVGTEDEKGTEVLAHISSRLANQFVEAVKHPEKETVA